MHKICTKLATHKLLKSHVTPTLQEGLGPEKSKEDHDFSVAGVVVSTSPPPFPPQNRKKDLEKGKETVIKKTAKVATVPCSILSSFDTVDPEGRQMQSTCIQNPSVKNVLLSLILAERQSYFHV